MVVQRAVRRRESPRAGRCLGRLHDATTVAAPHAACDDFVIDGRAELEDALDRLDDPWYGGPYAAGCRELLAAAAADVRRWLVSYDALLASTGAREQPAVLTHGEPKADNLLVTPSGLAVVDWDTALLAPAARDLWWLAGDDPLPLERYRAATGRVVRPDDIALYRVRWHLTDLALFVRALRAPHAQDADTEVAWEALQRLLRRGSPIRADITATTRGRQG